MNRYVLWLIPITIFSRMIFPRCTTGILRSCSARRHDNAHLSIRQHIIQRMQTHTWSVTKYSYPFEVLKFALPVTLHIYWSGYDFRILPLLTESCGFESFQAFYKLFRSALVQSSDVGCSTVTYNWEAPSTYIFYRTCDTYWTQKRWWPLEWGIFSFPNFKSRRRVYAHSFAAKETRYKVVRWSPVRPELLRYRFEL